MIERKKENRTDRQNKKERKQGRKVKMTDEKRGGRKRCGCMKVYCVCL